MNNSKACIHVVDDEEDLLEILSINLKGEGYDVKLFSSGNQFLSEILNNKELPDLVILDVMMEGINGFDVCRKISFDPRFKEIPIIFLTAKTEVESKIQGLKQGGDDYITKPFNMKELLLRVKTILKRTSKKEEIKTVQNLYYYKSLTLKRDSFLVTLNNQPLKLTKTEFMILLLFFENPGCFISRKDIINHVWDADNSFITERTIDVHVQRLRKKLKEFKDMISTYSGVGYGYFPDGSSGEEKV